MAYPFTRIGTKARKDPLGAETLNLLRQNILTIDAFHGVEHDYDGQHNALEVARTQGYVNYSSGYTLSFFNANAASVASGSTGEVTITLASGKFTTGMLALVSPASEDGANVPVRAGVEMPNATTLKVYLKKLASLGGNSWSATDCPFDLGIWSPPYPNSAPLISPLAEWTRGETVRGYSRWSAYPTSQGQQAKALGLEHDGSGFHNVRTIAKDTSLVTWDGAAYALENDLGYFASVSRTSTGIVEITWSKSISDYSIFVDCDYARAGGGSIGDFNYAQSPVGGRGSTTCTIYLYQYNYSANTWARVDCDFFVSLHHG